jgi:hypothetical protein
LVCTNYRHKTHNIKALYSFATQQADELKTAFPQDTKLSHRSFQLLKKSYIEARYSDKYEITVDELQWLAEQVAEINKDTHSKPLLIDCPQKRILIYTFRGGFDPYSLDKYEITADEMQ